MCRNPPLVVVCLLFTILLTRSAAAETIDDAFRADIEKLMDVTGVGALAAQMATLTSNAMVDAMKQTRPEVPDRAIAIVKEVLNEEFRKAGRCRRRAAVGDESTSSVQALLITRLKAEGLLP
jgi:hypothetical protein